MVKSLTFNGIDLGDYNLVVQSIELPVNQKSDLTSLQDKSHAAYGSLQAGILKLKVSVLGDSLSDTLANLDDIKLVLNERESATLVLDMLDDRYWTARFESLTGRPVGPGVWEGYLGFLVPDPLAYSITETSSDFSIDADPDMIEEAVGGTAIVEPVYTLTAGEDLVDITLQLENLTAGEELQWEGSLANGEELEIDVATWVIKKEGTESMSGFSGEFPRLLPGLTNQIVITGFSDTGTLNITYRERYI